jgi:hypothetical protein
LTITSFESTFRNLPPPISLAQFDTEAILKIPQPGSDPSATSGAPSRVSGPQRIVAVAVIIALACFGTTSCSKTQVGLSIAATAAVVVGATVGITLAVQNHNHTLQGCAFTGPSGLELRTNDAKIYTIEGSAATLKVGDRLKLHGSKLKKTKGSTGNQVFVVEKLKKDYGPCPADAAAPPAPAR